MYYDLLARVEGMEMRIIEGHEVYNYEDTIIEYDCVRTFVCNISKPEHVNIVREMLSAFEDFTCRVMLVWCLGDWSWLKVKALVLYGYDAPGATCLYGGLASNRLIFTYADLHSAPRRRILIDNGHVLELYIDELMITVSYNYHQIDAQFIEDFYIGIPYDICPTILLAECDKLIIRDQLTKNI